MYSLRLLIAAIALPVCVSAQTALDTLWNTYADTTRTDSIRLVSVHKLARHYLYSDPDSCLYYLDIKMKLAREVRDFPSIAATYNLRAGAFANKGEFTDALDNLFRSIDISSRSDGDSSQLADALNNVGYVFYHKGAFPRALHYFVKSAEIEEKIGRRLGLGYSYLNIGSIYAQTQQNEMAIEYYEKAVEIFKHEKDTITEGAIRVNMGHAYKEVKRLDESYKNYLHGVDLLKNTERRGEVAIAYSGLAYYHSHLFQYDSMNHYFDLAGEIYAGMDDRYGETAYMVGRGVALLRLNYSEEAIKLCREAYSTAKDIGALNELRDACECLYSSHRKLNNTEKALAYFEEMNTLTDSIDRNEVEKQLQLMEFRNEVVADSLAREKEKVELAHQHEKEVAILSNRRNLYMIVGGVFLLLSFLLYLLLGRTKRSRKQIMEDKHKSDSLLLNVLPESVANELLTTGKLEAREFQNVTVLFTDFIGFTAASKELRPTELIEELDHIFNAFDAISDKHGIQKIKTIGDAYMAAGGLPLHSPHTAANTVLATIEMQNYIETRAIEREASGLNAFRMRAGLHHGTVVAGIVGKKNFQYDIWGDTVNIASRMESAGVAGAVNVSQAVYEEVPFSSNIRFHHRGKVYAKVVGDIDMWFAYTSESSTGDHLEDDTTSFAYDPAEFPEITK